MSVRGEFWVLLVCALMLVVRCQEEEDSRGERQADFDFPGPRRTPATLPVFSPEGDGGRGGRGRPSFRPPPPDLGGHSGGDSGLDDLGGGGFSPLPPPRSFRPPPSDRPSSGVGGGRFNSRPSFNSDNSNEADFGSSKPKGGRGGAGSVAEEEVLTEEEKKPDRLTLLLQDSKFSCSEKKPGYYADDGLSCEVFHYCNEGVRHSWMCPAGTSFHQIHLICMQEGGDNICKQSTKYHFVNDYLYKALPDSSRNNNGTLRYADRYFPEDVNQGGGGGGGHQAVEERPSHGSSRPAPRPNEQSFRGPSAEQEEFFPLPPPNRHHPGGSGGRFRPQFDENQFLLPPPNFQQSPRGHQGGGGGGGGGHGGSGEDLGAFGSEEVRFQPQSTNQHSTSPSARPLRSRPRAQHVPKFL